MSLEKGLRENNVEKCPWKTSYKVSGHEELMRNATLSQLKFHNLSTGAASQ